MRAIWLLPAMVSCAVPAHADWMRAESNHFIVYQDADAATVRNAAERLEKLNFIQHVLFGSVAKAPTMKVRVYLLASSDRVQATMPFGGYGVSGYYDASVRGPYAVNTRADDIWNNFPAQLVLFHELTHHFMFQFFNATYPVWYSEGFADFIGATTIEAGNAVTIGAPVNNRYYSLRGFRKEEWIPVRSLLTAHGYADVADKIDLLYAEGWLLTHYLTLSGNRQGQLRKYLTEINTGRSYEDAANNAFGDLHALNDELKSYATRNKLPVKILTFKALDIGAIAVTPVSVAQGSMMTADIRMNAGIPANDADRFAASVRKQASRYPDDPVALRLRVEADRLAGDRIDRAAALKQWAAVAPRDPTMLLQQALLTLDTLAADKSPDKAAWDAARATLLAAYELAPNDPAILKAYYDAFKLQGIDPTPGAHNALFRALDIVPQDDEVRYALASDFEARGFYQDAIRVIRPAALETDIASKPRQRIRDEKLRARYRLAGVPLHETPREMLTRLEARAAASPPPPSPTTLQAISPPVRPIPSDPVR